MKYRIFAFLFCTLGAVFASAEPFEHAVKKSVNMILRENERYKREAVDIEQSAKQLEGQVPKYKLEEFVQDLRYFKSVALHRVDGIVYYVNNAFVTSDFVDRLLNEAKSINSRISEAGDELSKKLSRVVFDGPDETTAHECFRHYVPILTKTEEAAKLVVNNKADEQYIKIKAVLSKALESVKAGIKMAKSIDSTFDVCSGDNAEECVAMSVDVHKASSEELINNFDSDTEGIRIVMQASVSAVEAENKQALETFIQQLQSIDNEAVRCIMMQS